MKRTKNFELENEYTLDAVAVGSATIKSGQAADLKVLTTTDYDNKYIWFPEAGINCANCSSVEASPSSTTIYTVLVRDKNGCTASDTVIVEVNSTEVIFIPNAFSPNGDGNNDFLELYGNKEEIRYIDFKGFQPLGRKGL